MALRFLFWLLASSPLVAVADTYADRVLNRTERRNDERGGIVIRVSGPQGVIWQAARGCVAGPGSAAMTPETPFEIASITKMIVATACLRLVDQGRLSLDAPLRTLLPEAVALGFPPELTLRQLLGHRSGLPDYWTARGPAGAPNSFLAAFLATPDRLWQPIDILRHAVELRRRPPGRGFLYSDTNYVLAGLILERVTGEPLHEALRLLIFQPLGMKETWMSYREPRRGPAPSHRFEGSEDLDGVKRQSADWGGGGLVSTARDLEKFLRGLASGRLIGPARAAMQEWHSTGAADISHGLGIYRIRLDDGAGELIGHDGHGNAFAYYWPQRGITFTGTLNQTENDWWPLVEAALELASP